jgi:ABC-2 type transport system ATP-binding protein
MELVIDSLSKTYPNGVQALKGFSISISKGMFGLLGPNGAGKSTLMRTIATLQDADSGTIRLGNTDVCKQKQEIRKILGYLPQEFGLDPRLSAEKMLDHFAVLKGISGHKERKQVVESLLTKTNLWEVRKQKLGGFSGGMRQRFGIAQALIGNPKLLIVDEPTAGLDPTERVRFHNLLSEISQDVIIILSTHIVEDVSNLCTNMAIIHDGQLQYSGEPLTAIKAMQDKVWQKLINKEELEAYKEKYVVLSSKLFVGQLAIRIYQESDPEDGFVMAEAHLEDVYFHYIDSCNKAE